jgi:hypothetical protein
MGDLDRRKHDVDVIERVLGNVREMEDVTDKWTRVVDVDVHDVSGSSHSTLELMLGIEEQERRRKG